MTTRPFRSTRCLVAVALALVPACSAESDSNQATAEPSSPDPADGVADSSVEGMVGQSETSSRPRPFGDASEGNEIDSPAAVPLETEPEPDSAAAPSSSGINDDAAPASSEPEPTASGGTGPTMQAMGAGGSTTEGNDSPEGPGGVPAGDSCDGGVADAVYDRYVAPLVEGGQPSSCNQCHLSGVNLGNFVKSTPCESMACLIESGEVDLDDPTGSKILERIQLADPASGLITQPIIDREYQGFLAWIEYSARCQSTLCGEVPDACGGDASALDTPTGPLGECTERELAEQFERSVYSTLGGRCSGCHDPDGPKYEAEAILWLDSQEGGALRTMYNLVGRGALNTEFPELSLLLLKPLAESAGGVVHGGGDKFADTEDASYVETLRWIEAYAACKNTGDLGEFPEAPTVSIVTPQDGDVRTNPVRLDGLAIDSQEGQLLDGVRWESDRDGALASETVIAEANLSAGQHLLTFTATDSDGNTVASSVTVTVE